MKIKTRDITKIALLVALIAVGAFISIPIGPVPFTLQNFFVFMTGLLLTPFYAGLTVFIYVEVIFYAIGLPYMYVILNNVMGTSMNVAKVFSIGMIPFIIPDMAKAVVAAIIAPRILKALNN